MIGRLSTRQQQTSVSDLWETDYCGFSRAEGTSICMRISADLASYPVTVEIPPRSIHHDSTNLQAAADEL